MDKETVKKIICDFIDSIDEVQDFSISDDVEETNLSTLDKERIVRKPTGLTNIYITTYKKRFNDDGNLEQVIPIFI